MPMEIFVSRVDDLATLGRVRVGLDPSLFFPHVSFPFSCPRGVGEWKVFTLAVPLHSDHVEFLRCGETQDARGDTPCLDNIRPERKCIAGHFGVFP